MNSNKVAEIKKLPKLIVGRVEEGNEHIRFLIHDITVATSE